MQKSMIRADSPQDPLRMPKVVKTGTYSCIQGDQSLELKI